MSVTRETVAKIASLARIRTAEADLDRMVPELNGILAWVEQLPARDVEQAAWRSAVRGIRSAEECPSLVVGVHQVGDGAPARCGTHLEQPEGIVVGAESA